MVAQNLLGYWCYCSTQIREQQNHFMFYVSIEGQLPRNDRHVTRNGFLELVALFGPFKPGPDGCLQKVTSSYRQ